MTKQFQVKLSWLFLIQQSFIKKNKVVFPFLIQNNIKVSIAALRAYVTLSISRNE